MFCKICSSWLKYGVHVTMLTFSVSVFFVARPIRFMRCVDAPNKKETMSKQKRSWCGQVETLVLINWGYSRHNIFSEARLRIWMCAFFTSRPTNSFKSIPHIIFYSLHFIIFSGEHRVADTQQFKEKKQVKMERKSEHTAKYKFNLKLFNKISWRSLLKKIKFSRTFSIGGCLHSNEKRKNSLYGCQYYLCVRLCWCRHLFVLFFPSLLVLAFCIHFHLKIYIKFPFAQWL